MVSSAAMRFLLTCLQILSSLEGQFPPIHGVDFTPPRKTWQSDTQCSEITIGLTNIVFHKFSLISRMSMITLAAMHWPISFQLLSGVTSATHRGATGLNCSVPTVMPTPIIVSFIQPDLTHVNDDSGCNAISSPSVFSWQTGVLLPLIRRIFTVCLISAQVELSIHIPHHQTGFKLPVPVLVRARGLWPLGFNLE